VVGSLLFAFLPYHFWPGEGHLFLVAYFMIPLVVWLAVRIYQGWNVVSRPGEEEAGLARSSKWEMLLSIVICLAVGSTSVYHSYFACFLLLTAGIWASVYHRRPRLMALAVLFVAVISLSCMANLFPSILYSWRHGGNPEAVVRNPIAAEVFGLKINNLVLPPETFRLARYIPPASTEGSRYGSYLGLIGSVGFLILIAYAFMPSGGNSLMRSLSHLNLASVILGTVGSFSFLLALFVTPWIRCYFRLCVFLGFMGILAAVYLLDRFGRAYFQTPARRWIFQLGLGGVLLIGVWDQTDKHFIPEYGSQRAEFESDRQFIQKIESMIPGQAVFQLPYAPFPEFSVQEMNCYDHFRGYLHSRTLRWSGGAIKGRSVDFWQRLLCVQSVDRMVRSVALAGFKGIYIDRMGYTDQAKELESKLADVIGEGPLVSANDRLAFFDLSAYEKSLGKILSEAGWEREKQQVMAPLSIWPVWRKGFYNWEGPKNDWRWCRAEGTLELQNSAPFPMTVALDMSFASLGPRPARLVINGPGFSDILRLEVGKPWPYRKTVVLAPGQTTVRFACDGEEYSFGCYLRNVVFRVHNFRLECLDSADQSDFLAQKDVP
jgi:phosphoglycerol transferase